MDRRTSLIVCANHMISINNFRGALFLLLRQRASLARQRQQRQRSIQRLRLRMCMLATQIASWTHPKKFWKKPQDSRFWEKIVPESNDDFFKENFRMNRASFGKLCFELKALGKKEIQTIKPIPLDKKIAIALYSLGSSSEYKTIAKKFGVNKSTVCLILKDFCAEAWRVLLPKYLNKYPLNEATIRECVEGFEQQLGYPQCLGAIDGCHTEFRLTNAEAIDYINYRGCYSSILLALVDFRGRFLYINCGSPGGWNDDKVFEKSWLKKQHQNPIFNEMSTKIAGVSVPVHIIGDSAFRLSNMLMKPYPISESSSVYQQNFNNCLLKCQKVVDNAFGNLKTRFRRIAKGLDYRLDNINEMVKCACALHNFLSEHNDHINEHWMEHVNYQQENEEPGGAEEPGNNLPLNDNDPDAEKIREAISKHLYPEERAPEAERNEESIHNVKANLNVDDVTDRVSQGAVSKLAHIERNNL